MKSVKTSEEADNFLAAANSDLRKTENKIAALQQQEEAETERAALKKLKEEISDCELEIEILNKQIRFYETEYERLLKEETISEIKKNYGDAQSTTEWLSGRIAEFSKLPIFTVAVLCYLQKKVATINHQAYSQMKETKADAKAAAERAFLDKLRKTWTHSQQIREKYKESFEAYHSDEKGKSEDQHSFDYKRCYDFLGTFTETKKWNGQYELYTKIELPNPLDAKMPYWPEKDHGSNALNFSQVDQHLPNLLTTKNKDAVFEEILKSVTYNSVPPSSATSLPQASEV